MEKRNDAKNTLTLTASVFLTSSSDVVVGDNYWIGMAMYVDRDDGVIYSQQVAFTASDTTPADMVS